MTELGIDLGTDRAALHQEEMLTVITDTIHRHPRSLQSKIGPSEIGDPCDRYLIHRLHGDLEPDHGDKWRPTVGTALHTWMETVFTDANPASMTVWDTERTVTVGYLPDGTPITGSCDLFHHPYSTLTDYKFVGKRRIADARANGPGVKYRTQAHLYGGGLTLAGELVERVSIVFIPRDGQLNDSYYWSEPWDPNIWQSALERLNQRWRELDQHGLAKALDLHPHCDNRFCRFCRTEQPAPTTAEAISQALTK